VVMVLPSSGTLTLRRRANALLRCQNGTLSGSTAVSLSEVEERPTERAEILSKEELFLGCPTGLLEEGQSWYREVAGCCVRFANEGLLARDPGGERMVSLVAWISLNERDRRGRWLLISRR
jgi:hypothetical protein